VPALPTSANPMRISAFAFTLFFAISTFVAFIAGRVFGTSLNSVGTSNEFDSSTLSPSLHVPVAMNASPNADRYTQFFEIERNGNLLGRPSSLATAHPAPSLILDSLRPPTTNVGVEVQPGNDGRAWMLHEILHVEHLVHSALLTHSNPVRVAVLDDERGVLATEALKHSTVNEVEVFLLSGTEGSTSVNDVKLDGDDPRLSLIHTDPGGLPAALLQRSISAGTYDVILWSRGMYVKMVVCLLIRFDRMLTVHFRYFSDRNSLRQLPILEASRTSFSTAVDLPKILKASVGSLSSYGILCMGSSPTARDQAAMPDEVDQAGFESMIDYDSGKSSFWLAMKSRESRAFWFGRNQAEAELLIRKRMSEASMLSLHSFDAAGFTSQRFASRISEEIWCRMNVGECGSGHGFDPFVPNTPTSAFQVKHSGVGEKAGRGVFARQRVPKGSTIGMDTCVLGMFVPPATYELLTSMYFPDPTAEYEAAKHVADLLWKSVHNYVYGYGWVDNTYVRTRRDSSCVPGLATRPSH
jgi:hypothetical protein